MKNTRISGVRSGCIYSATDKAIYDALLQHKVTQDDLNKMYFNRGTLISNKTNKEKLADDFSVYIHGYHDYSYLSTLLGVSTRKERITSYDIVSGEVDLTELEVALQEVKKELEKEDDIVKIVQIGEKIIVEIEYQEPDFTKTEFRQVIDKDAKIVFSTSENGFNVMGPANNKLKQLTSILFQRLEEVDSDIQKEDINLTSIKNHSMRSEFFKKLPINMVGYEQNDVSEVFVYNPDDESESEGTHITKASLSGKGVTLSEELRSLAEKGFYICKMVWTVKRKNDHNSDVYEFEAQFSDAENCADFYFLPKGYYKKKDAIDSKGRIYNASRRNFNSREEEQFSKLIEKSAKITLDDIISSMSS